MRDEYTRYEIRGELYIFLFISDFGSRELDTRCEILVTFSCQKIQSELYDGYSCEMHSWWCRKC